MTNPNITDIVIVQDRSGSMDSIKRDAEGGINSFIREQKSGPGQLFVSLVEFDNRIDTNYLRRRADLVEDYRLIPRGSTALRDAIGQTINRLGNLYSSLDEEYRPGKVYFVINTDGFENASKEYSQFKISEMITHQQSKYNWQFVFLAANQDAIATAQSYGMSAGSSATYDSSNTRAVAAAYAGASASVLSSRLTGTNATFTDDQRFAANPDGK